MRLLAGKTPKGDELYIVTTSLGHYKIERQGTGPKSDLEDETFTSVLLAKRRLNQYNVDNAKAFAKQENIAEIVARGKAADEKTAREKLAKSLKNGDLDSTLQGE